MSNKKVILLLENMYKFLLKLNCYIPKNGRRIVVEEFKTLWDGEDGH